jgi:hypothetical protein
MAREGTHKDAHDGPYMALMGPWAPMGSPVVGLRAQWVSMGTLLSAMGPKEPVWVPAMARKICMIYCQIHVSHAFLMFCVYLLYIHITLCVHIVFNESSPNDPIHRL